MKIGFLITARLKSTRLPLKLLLSINGKSMVERVIDRAKQVNYIDEIVLCTSTNSQDRPLADVAIKNDIYYFLGSEEDVLQRLTDAASFFDMDYFVNITGENPLFSIEYANLVADTLRNERPDFVYLDGLPIGCGVYGLKTSTLKVVCKIKEEIDTEIWGLLINQPDIFHVKKIDVHEKYRLEDNLRITSDYIEDFHMICEIYNHYESGYTPSYLEVASLLRENPDILRINKMHKQIALDPQVIERISNFYKKNKQEVLALLEIEAN